MKYLLSWICKHIDVKSWQELGEISEIIKKLTLHVSEVASYQKIDYKKNKIALATIIENREDISIARFNNEEKIINLPNKKDLENGLIYIIIEEEDNKYRFATMKDLFSDSKNNYIAPLYGDILDNITFLKNIKKEEDYIIKIDNTSINNRPDLFSHRGLARELSLIFNKKLIPESNLIYDKKNIKKDQTTNSDIFNIASNTVTGINAVHGLFNEKLSLINYIFELSPLDITTHSYLVDLSNYVMLDIGQPMHVFDRKQIKNKLIIVNDYEGILDCLDNTTIKIEKNNTVIHDQNNIHSLVGIIGGKKSSVNIKTKEIIIESCAIKKENIIKTAQFYNKKTESVIRNEKGSSFEATELALFRFLKLANQDFNFLIKQYQSENKTEKENLINQIELSLFYVDKVIGININYEIIIKIFLGLEFKILENNIKNHKLTIKIPWWRRDINNQDDIIEEITRHIGYDSLPLIAPKLECKGNISLDLISSLKNNTILLNPTKEIVTYGIANEEQKTRWSYICNKKSIFLKNQYSDRQTQMITSVLPNFLDCINKEIQNGNNKISLFEINPLWHIKNNDIKEELYYTICFYEKETIYNFYEYIKLIKKIFYSINYELIINITNKNIHNHNLYSEISGDMYYNENIIGTCGFIDPLILYKENKNNGSVFAAEINLNKLLKHKQILNQKKNNYSFFDLSILVMKDVKISLVTEQLKIAFGNIMYIEIIDWFESIEWANQRSITIRIFIMNNDINDLYKEIKNYLIERNCIIR